MTNKIDIVGKKPRRIEIDVQPKRCVDPAELAAALGANPDGRHAVGKLDLIDLGELGTQLLSRLRSTGGRPALADATEICRVPLSAKDVKALEEITGQIAQTSGARPSPGQLVSIIVREYLRVNSTRHEEPRTTPALKQNDSCAPDASWRARLAEIASNANVLRKAAADIAMAAKEIENQIASSDG